MRCTDFTASIERFCATLTDDTGRESMKQQAVFFGLTGKALRRVLTLGARVAPKAVG